MIYIIFHKHKGRYGYRRITLELRKDGSLINHKTVKKLMDEMELKSEVRKVKFHSSRRNIWLSRYGLQYYEKNLEI